MKNIKVVTTACIAAAMLCGCSAGKAENKSITTLPPEPSETSAPDNSDCPAETTAIVVGEMVITTPSSWVDFSDHPFNPDRITIECFFNMTSGDFSTTYELFSNTLMQEMSEEQLAEMWEQMVLPLGESTGGCGFGAWIQDDYIIAFVENAEFEYGYLSAYFIYSMQGSIEGIQLFYS